MNSNIQHSPTISRRELLRLGFALTATGVLTACAAPVAPASQGGASAAQSSGGAAPASTEPVELRLSFWGAIEDMPLWKWGLDQWSEANPNIKIKWENTPWGEYWTKLQTQMAAGTPPDVVGMVSLYSQFFIRNGTLLPFDEYINREPDVDVDDFWPAIMTAYRYEGKTYCFPYDLSTVLFLFNKTAATEAGVEYPKDWTWDEFLAASKKLAAPEGQFAFLLSDSGIDTWNLFLRSNGTDIVSKDGTKCLLDTPEAIEAIQFYADLINKHRVAPSASQVGDIPMWETGKAVMSPANPQRVQVMETRVGHPRNNDKFEWDVVVPPRQKVAANTFAGGSFAIGNDSKHPDEAWQFVKFYTSKEILLEVVAKPSRGIPGRKSIADALLGEQHPEHQHLFLDVLELPNMEPVPIVEYGEVMAIMNKYLDPVRLGQATAAENMPKAAAEIDVVLARTAS